MYIFLFVFLCLLTLPAIIAFVRFVYKEFGECIEEPSEKERIKAKVLADYKAQCQHSVVEATKITKRTQICLADVDARIKDLEEQLHCDYSLMNMYIKHTLIAEYQKRDAVLRILNTQRIEEAEELALSYRKSSTEHKTKPFKQKIQSKIPRSNGKR